MGLVGSTEQCTECDFMDKYMDIVCSEVNKKISNPQETNSNKCEELKKNVREFVGEAKEMQNFYNKIQKEFRYSIEELKGAKMIKIQKRIEKYMETKGKNLIGLEEKIQNLDPDSENETLKNIKEILRSTDVLNSISVEEMKQETWFQYFLRKGKEGIEWIKELVSWFFTKFFNGIKWCTGSLKQASLCGIIGIVICLIIISVICQTMQVTKVVDGAHYQQIKNNENIQLVSKSSSCDNPFGIQHLSGFSLFNYYTGSDNCVLKRNFEYTVSESNYSEGFFSYVCPLVSGITLYVFHNPVFRSFIDGTKGFLYDSTKFMFGLNTIPLLPKYISSINQSFQAYQFFSIAGNVGSIFNYVSSPVALLNGWTKMALVAPNLLWQMFIGYDIRSYKVAVMERNILRPMIMDTLYKYTPIKYKWYSRLNAIYNIVNGTQAVIYMYKGLTNPAQVTMNFVSSAIRQRKMEQMEIKTLDKKVKDKLDSIEKIAKENLELAKKNLKLNKDTNKKVQSLQKEILKYKKEREKKDEEIMQYEKKNKELNKTNMSLNKEILQRLKTAKNERNTIIEKENSIVIQIQDIIKRQMLNKEITEKNKLETLTELHKNIYIDSIGQFEIINGEIYNTSGGKKTKLDDKTALLWANNRQRLTKQLYQDYEKLKEYEGDDLPNRQTILKSIFPKHDRFKYDAKSINKIKKDIMRIFGGSKQPKMQKFEEYFNVQLKF